MSLTVSTLSKHYSNQLQEHMDLFENRFGFMPVPKENTVDYIQLDEDKKKKSDIFFFSRPIKKITCLLSLFNSIAPKWSNNNGMAAS